MGKKDFVLNAKVVFGDYDIVIEVKYEEEKDLQSLILEKIGKIEGVKTTTTLIVAKEI